MASLSEEIEKNKLKIVEREEAISQLGYKIDGVGGRIEGLGDSVSYYSRKGLREDLKALRKERVALQKDLTVLRLERNILLQREGEKTGCGSVLARCMDFLKTLGNP